MRPVRLKHMEIALLTSRMQVEDNMAMQSLVILVKGEHFLYSLSRDSINVISKSMDIQPTS